MTVSACWLWIPVPRDFYICISPLWKYSVCFSVQILAAVATLLLLWSHGSQVVRTFLPGVLSTAELRGSKWCLTPLGAQGGLAEVCRLPGLGNVHGGLADLSCCPMLLPYLLLHVATLGVSTAKSQAREINQQKTSSTEKQKGFSGRLCIQRNSLKQGSINCGMKTRRELGAAINPNSTP